MRRSRAIKLLLLSSAGALTLTACDDVDSLTKQGFVGDEKQCASVHNPDECRQALVDARIEHARTAPAFTSKVECEGQFGVGNCETQVASASSSSSPSGVRSTSGSDATKAPAQQPGGEQSFGGTGMFVPMLMGFMMGRSLSGLSAQPVYRDASNTAYAGNRPVGTFNNRMGAPSLPSKVASGPSSRGGFGSEASSHSAAS